MKPLDPAVVLRALELSLANLSPVDLFRRFYALRFVGQDPLDDKDLHPNKRAEWLERFNVGRGFTGLVGALDTESRDALLQACLDVYGEEAARFVEIGREYAGGPTLELQQEYGSTGDSCDPGDDPVDISTPFELAITAESFRAEGWDAAVRDLAVWNDGEQLVGVRREPLAKFLERNPHRAEITRIESAREEAQA